METRWCSRKNEKKHNSLDRYEGNEKAVKSAAEANEIFLDSSPSNT